jgi:hypothetical protein
MRRHATEREEYSRRIAEAVATEQKVGSLKGLNNDKSLELLDIVLQRQADERQAWELQALARLKQEQDARDQALRAELSRSRDEQIKLVIARMDSEMQEERRRLKADTEAALAKLRDEHKAALAEVRADVIKWQTKCSDLQVRI